MKRKDFLDQTKKLYYKVVDEIMRNNSTETDVCFPGMNIVRVAKDEWAKTFGRIENLCQTFPEAFDEE